MAFLSFLKGFWGLYGLGAFGPEPTPGGVLAPKKVPIGPCVVVAMDARETQTSH